MRQRSEVVIVVAVLVSLTAWVSCESHQPHRTTSSLPDPDHAEVVNQACDDVVVTDTVHVPEFNEQHHRLRQLHVRSNLQVRTRRNH